MSAPNRQHAEAMRRRQRTLRLCSLVAVPILGCAVGPSGRKPVDDGLGETGAATGEVDIDGAADSGADGTDSAGGDDPGNDGVDSAPAPSTSPPDADGPPGDGSDATGSTTTGAPAGSSEDGCETVVFYRDADGDGFGDPADTVEACAAEGLYTATEAGDCCDADPAVNPDYGGDERPPWESEPNLCGHFDYDCNGDEERQVAVCGDDMGLCQSYWTFCPTPACGEEADLVGQYTNGLCAVFNAYVPQRCR